MSWHFTHQSPILAFKLTYCRANLQRFAPPPSRGRREKRLSCVTSKESTEPATPIRSCIKSVMAYAACRFISYSLSRLR